MNSTYYRLTKRDNPALLSLIIPCYNENEVLPILKKRLLEFIKTLPCRVEIIFINDGSTDNSLEFLWNWAEEDSKIKIINFARNFGHQLAVTAGMDAAVGDAVVIMDADLQDPPEVIHSMLQKYTEGYDVVYGQRTERAGESKFKLLTAWIFYRLMRKLIHKNLPVDTGDFRLISRNCLNTLNDMREMHRFLRGMGAWVGYPQSPVYYKRDPRAAGETKYPFSKMLKFAWTAAVSFSPIPLKISMYLGFIVAFIGSLVGIYAVYKSIMHLFFFNPSQIYNPGWGTLVTLVCLIGGSILICIGILGEYLGRIYEEIKGRPIYIIQTKKNLP